MGGEAVLFTPTVALALARIATLLLIPVMPILAVLRALRLFSPASTRWSPMMEYAALGVGERVRIDLHRYVNRDNIGFGKHFHCVLDVPLRSETLGEKFILYPTDGTVAFTQRQKHMRNGGFFEPIVAHMHGQFLVCIKRHLLNSQGS